MLRVLCFVMVVVLLTACNVQRCWQCRFQREFTTWSADTTVRTVNTWNEDVCNKTRDEIRRYEASKTNELIYPVADLPGFNNKDVVMVKCNPGPKGRRQ